MWECSNRYTEKQCKTVHLHDEYLKYIVHDVAKCEVVERSILEMVLNIVRYSVKESKYVNIKDVLNNF